MNRLRTLIRRRPRHLVIVALPPRDAATVCHVHPLPPPYDWSEEE